MDPLSTWLLSHLDYPFTEYKKKEANAIARNVSLQSGSTTIGTREPN